MIGTTIFVQHPNHEGMEYAGQVLAEQETTIDVQLDTFLVFDIEDENVPHPKDVLVYDMIVTETHILLSCINVPKPVSTQREELLVKLQSQLTNLVFRRVYRCTKTKAHGEAEIYSFENGKETHRTCTHHDFEHMNNLSQDAHNQKNENLKFRKRFISEKGNYFGFTTTRGIRKDPYDGKAIYFNNNNFAEFDVRFGGFVDQNEKAHDMPYTGDLLCGIVKIGDHGPFFEKWFHCSEQFMKMVTIIMDPQHESIGNNMNAIARRLKTCKFLRFRLDNPMATEEEIKERYHRYRYEECGKVENLYLWIGMCIGLNEWDVPNVEEAKKVLASL